MSETTATDLSGSNRLHNGPSLFVSYSAADAAFASWLVEKLRNHGLRPRTFGDEVAPGANFVEWVDRSIRESDYVIVLLSPSSVSSGWVEHEWTSALAVEVQRRRTFLIPALLPELTKEAIPVLLRSKSYLDFRGDREGALATLLGWLVADTESARDIGRLPSPLPSSATEDYPGSLSLHVIVHSTRFGRCFRVTLPEDATPMYVVTHLRHALSLPTVSSDAKLGFHFVYSYCLVFDGRELALDLPLPAQGVCQDSRLELFVRVEVQDGLDLDAGGSAPSILDKAHRTTRFRGARSLKPTPSRALPAGDEVNELVARCFCHVDE